ncbi:MAG: hypothetical protein ACJ71E_00190 [Nitrososphaeraceae archaeon]
MIINCHVNEALHHINQAGYGAHYIIIVSRYEKENMLLIADSLKEYLGDQPHTHFRKSLANCAEMGKNGLSVLADLGASPHKSMYDDLVDYELSLPRTYDDVALKGFCLYRQCSAFKMHSW